jgi:hypothetical protein
MSSFYHFEYRNTGDRAPFVQEYQGEEEEEHIHAHTVANRKFPSNPNYAEHIV